MSTRPSQSLAEQLKLRNPVAAFDRLLRIARHPSNLVEFPMDPTHEGERNWYTTLSWDYQLECKQWPIPNVRGNVTELQVYRTERRDSGDYSIGTPIVHIIGTTVGGKKRVSVRAYQPHEVDGIETARNAYRGPKAAEREVQRRIERSNQPT